ncbi:DUF6677 family protein [Phycisphaera mikurensis]|uniref:DUF6677 domain-containing protein n=1 Tax=Phycisphaera mikurensis (strain NBRC 102666 / KCTC 22515 / FYK2301M01) TaxID=1142394 RepID=I0ID88_PHYMF|nr:DUF6677 family protein [Phycisphaera mikurensis]MBB6442351.1 TM2 domain-containing membrane protein YozV [Phycisphaera mikurensis]BAM03226.1 hypothetical protein PSMK_10670 [Phycisphaera mikurensis NBRC 102666]
MPHTPDAQSAAAGSPAAAAAAGAGEPRDRPLAQHLLAAAVAWGFPGLGHLLLGRTHRGLVLAVAITTLFLAGLLIGGVAVVDRRDHPAWFISQALVAPAFLVDAHHQKLRDRAVRAVNRPGGEAAVAAYAPSFGRSQEQGTLYTAAAGLLNLLAILDVAHRRPSHERRRGPRRRSDGAAPAEPPAGAPSPAADPAGPAA